MKRTLRALVNTCWLLAACASTSAGGQGAPQGPAGVPTQPPPFGAAPSEGTGGAANVTTSPTGVATLGANAGDPGGDADFAAARAKFDKGDREGAQAALEGFLAQHPRNGNRAAADAMLGRLALARGDAVAAKRLLSQASAGLPGDAGNAARYYLGFAELRLGNLARARELLSPFVPKGAPPPAAGDDAAVELRGALAEATGPADPTEGLELWEGYYHGARDAE